MLSVYLLTPDRATSPFDIAIMQQRRTAHVPDDKLEQVFKIIGDVVGYPDQLLCRQTDIVAPAAVIAVAHGLYLLAHGHLAGAAIFT